MKITPRPGDYVSTKGMTEDQYHAIVKVFKDAGAQSGEPIDYDLWVSAQGSRTQPFVGIRRAANVIFHGKNNSPNCLDGRELSLSDLLEPEVEEVVWDGKGLPPVGVSAEFKLASGAWAPGLIIAHAKESGAQCAIFQMNDDWTFCNNPKSFRPIKSERQEVIKEISSVHDEWLKDGGASVESFFDKLYNAGFRKTN